MTPLDKAVTITLDILLEGLEHRRKYLHKKDREMFEKMIENLYPSNFSLEPGKSTAVDWAWCDVCEQETDQVKGKCFRCKSVKVYP